MIQQTIAQDVTDEFAKLCEDFAIHLNGDFDITLTKSFMEQHVPKEIIYKSELLLDTLLNYLIEDARQKLKPADAELQIKFLDADFRKRFHDWVGQIENQLCLNPDAVEYSSDPRSKQGLIVAGITFLVGSGITLLFVPAVIKVIVSGLVTIALSTAAFKVGYDSASAKSRELMKKDIDEYLVNTEKQVQAWLSAVIDAFYSDFKEFCDANGFNLEER